MAYSYDGIFCESNAIQTVFEPLIRNRDDMAWDVRMQRYGTGITAADRSSENSIQRVRLNDYRLSLFLAGSMLLMRSYFFLGLDGHARAVPIPTATLKLFKVSYLFLLFDLGPLSFENKLHMLLAAFILVSGGNEVDRSPVIPVSKHPHRIRFTPCAFGIPNDKLNEAE